MIPGDASLSDSCTLKFSKGKFFLNLAERNILILVNLFLILATIGITFDANLVEKVELQFKLGFMQKISEINCPVFLFFPTLQSNIVPKTTSSNK